MSVTENLTTFYDRPVADWSPVNADDFDYIGHVPRLRLDIRQSGGETSIVDLLDAFLARPETLGLKALVFGVWGAPDVASNVLVEGLFTHKSHLDNLEALFVGDITPEEIEMAAIRQSDLSLLWQACPNLRELVIRGGDGLSVGSIEQPKLETLIIQTAGLSRRVVHDVFTSPLSSLRHLELWLGSSDHGGDTQAGDFEGLILANFPALRSFGLCYCAYADDLASVIARAPVLARLERLDLSMGTLGDNGAEALLTSSTAARLQELDLHHSFISQSLADKLRRFSPKVNLDGPKSNDTP